MHVYTRARARTYKQHTTHRQSNDMTMRLNPTSLFFTIFTSKSEGRRKAPLLTRTGPSTSTTIKRIKQHAPLLVGACLMTRYPRK